MLFKRADEGLTKGGINFIDFSGKIGKKPEEGPKKKGFSDEIFGEIENFVDCEKSGGK
jgi:hypothetical protein